MNDIAAIIVQNGREIVPSPTYNLQIGKIFTPGVGVDISYDVSSISTDLDAYHNAAFSLTPGLLFTPVQVAGLDLFANIPLNSGIHSH